MSDSIIRARIDAKTKEKAAKILKGLGLTSSAAIRLFLQQVVNRKALPFAIESLTHSREAKSKTKIIDGKSVDERERLLRFGFHCARLEGTPIVKNRQSALLRMVKKGETTDEIIAKLDKLYKKNGGIE